MKSKKILQFNDGTDILFTHYQSNSTSYHYIIFIIAAMFIWPPLTRKLIDTYSWRGASLIIGGVGLHGAVFGALLRPPPMKRVIKVCSRLNVMVNFVTNRNSHCYNFQGISSILYCSVFSVFYFCNNRNSCRGNILSISFRNVCLISKEKIKFNNLVLE